MVNESDNWRGSNIGGLNTQEIDEFLAGPWLARLACLKPNGSPYVVPVWYHWDGAAFWLVARKKSEWARFIADDPRVSLVIDEPEPPIRKVICEGLAEVIEEPVGPILDNGKSSIWNQIGSEHTGPRYLGEKSSEYRDSINTEPCWTFKICPEKLVTWQGFDWHDRYKNADKTLEKD